MKNLLTLTEDEGKNPKDQRLNLDIVLRLNRLNVEYSAFLVISKVGFFFKPLQIN